MALGAKSETKKKEVEKWPLGVCHTKSSEDAHDAGDQPIRVTIEWGCGSTCSRCWTARRPFRCVLKSVRNCNTRCFSVTTYTKQYNKTFGPIPKKKQLLKKKSIPIKHRWGKKEWKVHWHYIGWISMGIENARTCHRALQNQLESDLINNCHWKIYTRATTNVARTIGE